ncbi:MAG: hypothetical protein KGZ35_08615 [Truepera sp.]|nr:hypothetical protein [Truepera sp.]
MKPNVALLKADIRDELDKIARLSQEFQAITPRLNEPPGVPFYDRAAIGYHRHYFYHGCEAMCYHRRRRKRCGERCG